jgi:hypothetical protein
MALTIKHRSDGTFYEQGDTQGLVVPASLLTDYAAYTIPVGFGGSGNFEFTLSRWTIPEDGDYLFTIGAGFNAGSHVVTIVFYVNGVINYIPIFGDGQDNNKNGNVTWLRRCTKGEVVALGFQMNAATGIQGSAIFNKIKLNALSPYIIANKGALVSGGAFQFDADGNGYIKNYFPLGQEVRVGTYWDGKPIYQKAVQCTTASGTITIIGAQADILPNIKEMVTSEIRELRGTQLTQSITGSISAEFGANVRITFPTSWGAGYLLTVTLYYTKTTD